MLLYFYTPKIPMVGDCVIFIRCYILITQLLHFSSLIATYQFERIKKFRAPVVSATAHRAHKLLL